jgi:hypothetical protein
VVEGHSQRNEKTGIMYVYAQSGILSVNNEFVERTWLAFFHVDIGEDSRRKFLGTVDTEFPVKYPLTLDNGLVIQAEDYYRKYE